VAELALVVKEILVALVAILDLAEEAVAVVERVPRVVMALGQEQHLPVGMA
jgi:hypothetical protein